LSENVPIGNDQGIDLALELGRNGDILLGNGKLSIGKRMIRFHDMRLRRLVEDLVFPSPKEGMNPRSLAYLRLALCDKRRSVLFASFPKCGWNWTGDILEYCIARTFTGSFEPEFRDSGTLKERMKKPVKILSPADSRSTGRRKIREMFPELTLDYCLHTHGHWGYSPLWGLDQAKTVFVIRNIPTSLFSYYKSKLQLRSYPDFESFLQDGNLDRAILYHNTWGDYCARPDSRFRIFRYEEMRKEPAIQFAAMYEYVFGRAVDSSVLSEALDYFSFENQKKREFQFEKDEARHFHYQGGTDYSDRITPETLARLHERLKNELRHTFGYEYGC
jgi:hypothetical protein